MSPGTGCKINCFPYFPYFSPTQLRELDVRKNYMYLLCTCAEGISRRLTVIYKNGGVASLYADHMVMWRSHDRGGQSGEPQSCSVVCREAGRPLPEQGSPLTVRC